MSVFIYVLNYFVEWTQRGLYNFPLTAFIHCCYCSCCCNNSTTATKTQRKSDTNSIYCVYIWTIFEWKDIHEHPIPIQILHRLSFLFKDLWNERNSNCEYLCSCPSYGWFHFHLICSHWLRLSISGYEQKMFAIQGVLKYVFSFWHWLIVY